MCSTSCCPALHVSFSSVPTISRVLGTRFGAHVGSSLCHLRPVSFRERVARGPSVRAFAVENGASDKGETSSTGENGNSGAVVKTDAVSSKGFGATVRAGPAQSAKDKKEKKSKPGTIRRSAPLQPLLQSAPKENQVSQIETAYVVSLAFLFGLIFVEGLVLAASGFLPEDWDQFLVNNLYPSFTPTVGLFLLGAAGYGVFKYFGLGSSKE